MIQQNERQGSVRRLFVQSRLARIVHKNKVEAALGAAAAEKPDERAALSARKQNGNRHLRGHFRLRADRRLQDGRTRVSFRVHRLVLFPAF